MALPAVRSQPPDILIELDVDVGDYGCTTVVADCAAPGVNLAIGTTVVAGDHEGNSVLATVTGLGWVGCTETVDLALHMESFVPAPRTDERETMISAIPFSDASDPSTDGDTAPSAGHPKPNLGVIATAGFVWRSPTTNDKPGCLQVAAADDGVFIRDSADPSKALAFTTAEFAAFCEGVDAGDYRDLLPPII